MYKYVQLVTSSSQFNNKRQYNFMCISKFMLISEFFETMPCDERVPTSACVWVLHLGWSPWQVVVEISAVLTVQALCIVFAYTATMNLANQNVVK